MIDNQAQQLVLNPNITETEAYPFLGSIDFTDWLTAYRCFKRMPTTPKSRLLLAEIVPSFLQLLTDSTNPDLMLTCFDRLVQNTPNQTRLFQHLVDNPRAIEILIKLFTGSQFLTEILLRDPKYFQRLTIHHQLTQPKTVDQLQNEANALIALLMTTQDDTWTVPVLDALRRFQRWELLRIGASDLLGVFDLPTVTSQLSHLTDALAQVCLEVAVKQTGILADEFFVVAMGKLGGEELNYSSDIDLLFLCKENAVTKYRLGQFLIDNLARTTDQGFLYRVDMRLRPWGRSGPLVSTIEAYLKYLNQNARLWEKQALLKARVIAGNRVLGAQFIRRIQPLLFGTPPDVIRQEVYKLKQRIESQLRKKGRNWGEVKLGEGSIRDIEFVTQYLQLAYGGTQTVLRSNNTLQALDKLYTAQFLTPEEYRALTDGYIFLRTIEHHLQLMHYRQTHTLPDDETALDHLAYRLGFEGRNIGQRFIQHYQQHSKVIRLVYQQKLGNGTATTSLNQELHQLTNSNPSTLVPHLVRMHPSYVTVFDDADIQNHAKLISQLNENTPVRVEPLALADDYWRVTIVGYDYLGKLSGICGLMFVHGLNIVEGHVFSYGPSVNVPLTDSQWRRKKRRSKPIKRDTRRKIVDVFTIGPLPTDQATEMWNAYIEDLTDFVKQLQNGKQHQAQGQLAKKVATAMSHEVTDSATLYPVDIKIDNEASHRHTLLYITAPDTIGFLYTFTNALSFININIRRMTVNTMGAWVEDVLYVTNTSHEKITSPAKQREIRLAAALIKQFTHLLPQSPNPESALLHFREFVAQLFTQPNWPEQLTSLEQPQVMGRLARLLGVSDFLWDDFLRMQHDNLFPVVEDIEGLAVRKTKDELREALQIMLQQEPYITDQQIILNAFKDREMFRIDMRQIMGHITEFGQFSGELSDLAEVVVSAAYHLAAREIRAAHGLPKLSNGHSCPMAVCALGKCGGRELGFASDIELMFIYAGNGRTTGPRVITTAEYFNKLVFKVNDIIKTKREGIFELDLRLRPYGKAGSMAVSLESFQRYFAPQGEAWPYERQALVKLRPITGDIKLGQKIIRLRDELIYDETPFDVAAMRAMRERQLRHSVVAGTFNAKLSLGGLVDIEYLVQGLQITYGYRSPDLRRPNTRQAMEALARVGIIPNRYYPPLMEALNFFRQLINALRMVRGNTKDLTVPPPDSDEFAFLARRLHYGRDKIDQLQADLARHITAVQDINKKLLA